MKNLVCQHASACLSVYMPLPACLTTCLYLPVCLHASACLSVYMPLPVCLSTCLCLSVCLHASACLSVDMPLPASLNVHPSWANTLISLFYLMFSKTSLLSHISLWRWHCPANRRVIRRIKAFGHICLSLLGQTDHNHLSTVSA